MSEENNSDLGPIGDLVAEKAFESLTGVKNVFGRLLSAFRGGPSAAIAVHADEISRRNVLYRIKGDPWQSVEGDSCRGKTATGPVLLPVSGWRC